MLDCSPWYDAVSPEILSDTFIQATEKASCLQVSACDSWINPDTSMKLCPDRWIFWGETVAGAIGHVDWIWTKEPSSTWHSNHPSAIACSGQLGAQLDQAASIGMIEYCPPGMATADFAANILPLGAVTKPNGKVRMLVDPSLPGVNQCMAQLPCQLTCIENMFLKVEAQCLLGKRDLLNGFFHCVLSPSARKHMAFTHPVSERVARWVVLPQGTRQSPSIFCGVTDASARIFNRLFSEHMLYTLVYVYVDDYVLFCFSGKREHIQKAFTLMDEEGVRLGLSFNPEKDVGRDGTTTCLEALGLEIDAPSLTLRLPETKRAAYLHAVSSFIDTFHGQQTCPRKPVEQLVGKLVFACKVCRWGFLFVQCMLDALYPLCDPRTKLVALCDAVWFELTWWKETLSTGGSRWITIQQHMMGTKEFTIRQDQFDHQLFSDASKRFGVGGILGPDQSLSQKWSGSVEDIHIGQLELQAVLDNLRHFKNTLSNTSVLVWVDNIQAMLAINKGASRLPGMRSILKEMASLGMQYNFHVKAKYIKGEINPADAPSRGKKSNVQNFWFLPRASYDKPQSQVDVSLLHHSLKSLSCCPMHVDNLQNVSVSDLQGKIIWSSPPFACIEQVMNLLVSAWRLKPLTTVVTMVVPYWPTATWFLKYLRRKKPLFRVIHEFKAATKIFRFHSAEQPCSSQHPVLILRLSSDSTDLSTFSQ